jgi:hypothetical protein
LLYGGDRYLVVTFCEINRSGGVTIINTVSPTASPGYARAAVYFLVMLAGMAGEYMFGLKKFKQFTVEEFVRPFWVSLIVFSVPWSLVDKGALTYGSVLACYQNGFFWKR